MVPGKAFASSRHNKMWTHRDCDKTCTGSSQMRSQHWEGKQTVSLLSQKLFVIDTCCGRVSLQFSLQKYYWGCQPHFRTDTMPRSRWPTQNRFCFYVCASCFVLFFGGEVSYEFSFFIILLGFFLFLFLWVRKKKHEVGWIEWWGGGWHPGDLRFKF